MISDFKVLKNLTEALYQADVAALRAISNEEAATRAELAVLDEQERAAFLPAAEDALALRSIGADLNWRGWVSRKRETLNLQLANILARKARAMQVLRISYGKNAVTAQLCDMARSDTRSDRANRDLSQIQAHGVIVEWSKRRADS